MQYISVLTILTATAFLALLPGSAWGHGMDVDSTNAADVAGKKIQITTEIVSGVESEKNNIIITVLDKNLDKTVGDVTLHVRLQHDGKEMFSGRFIAPDGVLRFAAEPSLEPVKIGGIWEESLGAWHAGESEEIILTGVGFDSKGLYTFEIYIEKAAWTDEPLGDVKAFRTDVSLVEEITHTAYDSRNSAVKFATRSYFDAVTDFKYDSEEKRVSFKIPFDWDDGIISHIPVVHIETRFPKNFTEFYSPGYAGTANGIELFDSSIIVDDYTKEDLRIVHFVLLGDHLRYLKNVMEKTENIPEEITFALNQSDEIKFPLSAMTRDEQFQVDLSWIPLEISHEEKTRFIFTIRDGLTGEPLRHSSYDFLIIQSDSEIYKTSGKAVVGGDYEEYTFAQGQTGSTIIRFENIRGTGMQTEFGVMVIPELGAPLLVLAAAVTVAAMLGRFKIVSV